jgi:hypothetical protein
MTAGTASIGRPSAVTTAGRWYPELPPRLDGEDTAAYAARLTSAPGPFDHVRNPDCAAGRHDGCRPGQPCRCPHHADRAPDIVPTARPALTAGARELAARCGLPEVTGLHLMALTREVACGGRRPPRDTLRTRISAAYGSPVSANFTDTVADIYQAAVTGAPR